MSYDDDLAAGDRQLIATFGRPVRVTADREIVAIFNTPYSRTDIPGGGYVQGVVSSLDTLSDDVNGLAKRDTIQVPLKKTVGPGGVEWAEWTTYTIREIQPDGAGLTIIYLDPTTTSPNSQYEIY